MICFSPSARAQGKIWPGYGVENVAILGEQIEMVLARNREQQASQRRVSEQVVEYTFKDRDVVLEVNAGKVTAVCVGEPGFATTSGWGIGTGVKQVKSGYSSKLNGRGGRENYELVYPEEGIAYRFVSDRVLKVTVRESSRTREWGKGLFFLLGAFGLLWAFPAELASEVPPGPQGSRAARWRFLRALGAFGSVVSLVGILWLEERRVFFAAGVCYLFALWGLVRTVETRRRLLSWLRTRFRNYSESLEPLRYRMRGRARVREAKRNARVIRRKIFFERHFRIIMAGTALLLALAFSLAFYYS